MNTQTGRIDSKTAGLLAALFLLPLGIMVLKLPILSTSASFTQWFALEHLPKHMHRHVEFILFVPLGGLVVSFFRLTLGIRVLGLFRPILIAIAFRIMGIPIGLGFLIVVLVLVTFLRPLLRGAPYYARVPVLLSLVATFLVIPVVASQSWPAVWLQHLAYFPIIALCLTCEAFTKALDENGMAEAIWRTITTVTVAAIITGIVRIPEVMQTFLRYPELLVVQAGLILAISEYLDFQVFEGKNPFARKSANQGNAPALLLEPTVVATESPRGILATEACSEGERIS